jgi:hypothetical protein
VVSFSWSSTPVAISSFIIHSYFYHL